MNIPMTPPIQLESISKCYRIFQNPQDRFKQALLDRFQNVLGRKTASPLYREHWALRDVSFELQPGEAVGILGRNGAGKSTLLQIIAGTLQPTAGNVKTSGRITALLELGSGFNPEFTGRENVFLNAQILGLSKEETLARFDDIASFADIGDFIDQPVKTYSSGMMMRLAFAVQTAVQPKVLIVDEALSVGDMFFQTKCMARIKRLINDGVSLLFVSHDIGTVRQICKRALILDQGNMLYFGDVSKGADIYTHTYLASYNQRAQLADTVEQTSRASLVPVDGMSIPSGQLKGDDEMSTGSATQGNKDWKVLVSDRSLFNRKCNFERLGNGGAKFLNVCLVGESGQTDSFSFGEKVTLFQLAKFGSALSNINASYKIRTPPGVDVVFGDTRMFGDLNQRYNENEHYVFAWEFNLTLGHGSYNITSALAHPPDGLGRDWEFVDFVPISCEFIVLPREPAMIDGLTAWDANLSVRWLNETID